jgi:hypothetical protein
MPADRRSVRIVSQCDTWDDFAALVRPYLDGRTLFVATEAPPAEGDLRFAIALADGRAVLRGEGRVVERHAHRRNFYGHPGIRLRLDRLDADGERALAELAARAPGVGGASDRLACQVVADDAGPDPGASDTIDGPIEVTRPSAPGPATLRTVAADTDDPTEVVPRRALGDATPPSFRPVGDATPPSFRPVDVARGEARFPAPAATLVGPPPIHTPEPEVIAPATARVVVALHTPVVEDEDDPIAEPPTPEPDLGTAVPAAVPTPAVSQAVTLRLVPDPEPSDVVAGTIESTARPAKATPPRGEPIVAPAPARPARSSRPPTRPIEATEIVRIAERRTSTRGPMILVALIAALLGLGVGYALWGLEQGQGQGHR